MADASQGDRHSSSGHPEGYELINIGKQSGNGNKQLQICFKKIAELKNTVQTFISESIPSGCGSKIAGIIHNFLYLASCVILYPVHYGQVNCFSDLHVCCFVQLFAPR